VAFCDDESAPLWSRRETKEFEAPAPEGTGGDGGSVPKCAIIIPKTIGSKEPERPRFPRCGTCGSVKLYEEITFEGEDSETLEYEEAGYTPPFLGDSTSDYEAVTKEIDYLDD